MPSNASAGMISNQASSSKRVKRVSSMRDSPALLSRRKRWRAPRDRAPNSTCRPSARQSLSGPGSTGWTIDDWTWARMPMM